MKRLVTLGLAALLLGSAGCHLFSKKKKAPTPPPDSPYVAKDVEKDFMRRWIDKRTADLVAQGSPAAAARTKAEAEFKSKFSYTDAARQSK
jgi:hypothetical protein